MGVVASFSYANWALRYPEFSNVSGAQAQLFWNEATLYCFNDGSGPCTDLNTQTVMLNQLTAHIAFLAVGTGGIPATGTQLASPGQAPSGLVGRIASASEGSVSVSVDNGSPAGSAAWYMQTQYGAAFWDLSAQFRQAHFITSRRRRR